MNRCGIDAVLIGNAAAALHGAPVTTVDFDFFFRRTPANVKRLKALAQDLGATILRPYYPVSELFRLSRDADGLQVDFMGAIEGIRSFEGVRARSRPVTLADGVVVRVAALADIIKSKRAAGRPQDRAILPLLRKRLSKKRVTRKERLEALRKENDLALRDLIRRRLAAPLAQRLNFLRKRIGVCRTAL